MTIKTFRGILADGGQDQIYLAGGDSISGYRIVKFELMPGSPGLLDYEAVVQIFKTEQSSSVGTVDFTDNTFLGCAFYMADPSTANPNAPTTVVFDNEVFNQDIFVTYKTNTGSGTMNYYIELEEVKMSDGEAAVVNFNAALIHT